MIRLDSVSKTYNHFYAVNHVSFSVKKGSISGLIGHNGAGKTTIIRLISALIRPTSGTIWLNGLSVEQHPVETKKRLGVLFGGDVSLYSELTARENIEYSARLRGLKTSEIHQRICYLNDFLHFEAFLDKRTAGFSRGMRQKIALAKALVHDPEVLILDEPTTGLDICSTMEIHKLITQLKTEQKTILITTHNLYEIETLFDEIFVMKKGHLEESGITSGLLAQDKKLMERLRQMLGDD